MSFLFFMDESGHDHKTTPFEVRGGVVLHASRMWAFIQQVKALEDQCFGATLASYGHEIKGHRLLDRKRFEWAAQAPELDGVARRKHALGFLEAGRTKAKPKRVEFTAYGQACLGMARGIFQLLIQNRAVVIAACVPRGVKKPEEYAGTDYLRKDHVFLFERYYAHLEAEQEHGLIVMDESDKAADRRFVERMEGYFTKTDNGRRRTAWIVPSPMFVASDMAAPVQAADVCIYCINWGFRLSGRMEGDTREEIRSEFGPLLSDLQLRGEIYREGDVFPVYGIVPVSDPYTPRQK